ncbi:MAG TPA: GrpB family protein, partial [Rubrobacter sp.]|nr:GrpB family protein [Rubrobacter sp.]
TRMIHQHLPRVIVEHIGSTAAPGFAGKGVIDLLTPYREGELEPVKDTLQEPGCQRQSTRDPFPEDMPMDVGSVEYDGDTFRLHVVPASSDEPGELRAFRDRLRNDPEMMDAYVRQRREIIEGGTNDAVYYSIRKGAFVREVLDEMRRQISGI